MKRLLSILASIVVSAVLMSGVVHAQAEDTRTVMKTFIDSIQQNNGKITINVIGDLLNIAEGNVEGYRADHKFGRNIDVDSGIIADIWDGGYSGDESLIWVAPTQARLHNITSTSAGDTSAGTGTRTLRLYGLVDWISGEISEVITMNGTSNVSTLNAYVMINRMQVLTKGASPLGSNVGVITATAVTDNTVTSQIRAGVGSTEQTPYGFPSSQNMYIDRIDADLMKTGGNAGLADMDFLYNPEPQTELTNFVSQHPFGLLSVGSSAVPIVFKHPKKLVGPGLVKIQAIGGAANMDISAGFDFVLVDNNNNSPNNLLAGGGPNDGFKLADTHGRFLLPD